MSKVKIMDHPLIQHKIGFIRRMETGSKDFRQVIGEIAMLMCYEATRDLKLQDVEIETPICKMTAKELEGKKLAVVPILRAGLGMVDGMLTILLQTSEGLRGEGCVRGRPHAGDGRFFRGGNRDAESKRGEEYPLHVHHRGAGGG